MASSRTPLLASDHRNSIPESEYEDGDQTRILGGLATTSPTRPFASTFNPTLILRSLALLLAVPAFIIFAAYGGHYAAPIVFLSFVIARQIVVLSWHFGRQLVAVNIEIKNHKLQELSTTAQGKWIARGISALADVVNMLGLLISLSLLAHQADVSWLPAPLTHAVILGFIVFGLNFLSFPDFGSPSELVMVIAIEKPAEGLLKLTTSFLHGTIEDREDEYDDATEASKQRRTHKGSPRLPRHADEEV